MTEGRTMQAKNLSEKEEMSTDWLLKHKINKKKKLVLYQELPTTQGTLKKQPSVTRVYKTYIAKYF